MFAADIRCLKLGCRTCEISLQLPLQSPRHGCGSKNGTQNSVFFRHMETWTKINLQSDFWFYFDPSGEPPTPSPPVPYNPPDRRSAHPEAGSAVASLRRVGTRTRSNAAGFLRWVFPFKPMAKRRCQPKNGDPPEKRRSCTVEGLVVVLFRHTGAGFGSLWLDVGLPLKEEVSSGKHHPLVDQ